MHFEDTAVGSGEFQNLSKCFEIEDLVQGSLLLASRLILVLYLIKKKIDIKFDYLVKPK